jgi:hypothetical protein
MPGHHPAYGMWSQAPSRRFLDTHDAAIIGQQVADHAFNLREFWAGAEAHQSLQRATVARKTMARQAVDSRRPSGAPLPSDFAAAARRHPEGVRAAHNAKLVAQLQELDQGKVELWLAKVRERGACRVGSGWVRAWCTRVLFIASTRHGACAASTHSVQRLP